jgi:hypothetical protein
MHHKTKNKSTVMKKFFISLLMLISVFSYAGTPGSGEKVNARIQAALEKEFKGAQYIVWQSLKDHQLFHAKFIYNNEQVNAFFEEDGSLLAIGRYIATSSLPLAITKSFNSKYAEYELKDAIEYSKSGETSYVVSLENEKTRLVVEAYSNGNSYVFKKEKKNLSAKL